MQILPSGMESFSGMVIITVPRPRHLKDSREFIHRGACARQAPTVLRNSSPRRFEVSQVLVVSMWDGTSWMTQRVHRLFVCMLVAFMSIRSSGGIILKCRAAPLFVELWMLVSGRVVPLSKMVASEKLTPCRKVFWLTIVMMFSLVVVGG